jgi:hypothetical protein
VTENDIDYDDYQEQVSADLTDIRSTLEAIHSTLKEHSQFYVLGWVVFVVVVMNDWSGSWLDRWTDKVWYVMRGDAEYSNITVSKRPTDCNFWHAPLGGKGCDYKKHVEKFGAADRKALVDLATTVEA